MSKELDVITKEIPEANWTMFKRILKTIPLLIACAAVGMAGARLQAEQYRYTSYIDPQTVSMAMDMQAICDVRKVCDKGEILERFNTLASEGALFRHHIEDPTLGK